MQAWMRKLVVTLIAEFPNSQQKHIVFGTSDDDLSIRVTGKKYLSPMKDEFEVVIKNIPLANAEVSVTVLKDLPFRYITIEAGYRDMSMDLFMGYIVYISSKREDNGKTISVHIVCSGSYTYNNLTGKTLTMKAGTDYKTAIEFAARLSGILPNQLELSPTLRYKRLKKNMVFDGTISSMLIEIQNQDKTIFCHCDYTSRSKFMIWDGMIYRPRVIELNEDNIILANGFPTIEDQGVVFTVLPFFNFIPGDEVIFKDDSFINRAIESLSGYTQTPYPDIFVGEVSPLETNEERINYVNSVKGQYIIKELRYDLENRGKNFTINIKTYARSLYDSLCQTWTD